MHIAYCTNVRLPSERAHGHQIAQVCDALVILGHAVTIFAPFRRNVVTENYWTYYGAKKDVELRILGSFDYIGSTLTPGVLGLFLMNRMLRQKLSSELRAGAFDLLYTRTPALLPALLATHTPVIFELHQLPRRNLKIFVSDCNRCVRVVCLTSSIRDVLLTWGVRQEKLTVEGDGVDLRRFENLPSQPKVQAKFFLKTDRAVVGYVGRLKTLGMDKGVMDLLKALKRLQEQKKFFGFIVGGPEGDRKFYEAEAKKLGLIEEDVKFTGEIAASSVPSALAACDILAMPFPDLPHYRHHMSPLKMFEYMATDRPIITSDLPTIRDVLSEETAVFCMPGDSESLANALQWIQANSERALEKAKKALELVRRYSWEERMKRILA